jgi:hypothetical protein
LPLPILLVLAVLLPVGPIGLWVSGGHGQARRPSRTLAQIARGAGCRLREFEDGMRTNPPVTGRFVERIRASDGSYVGRRPPSAMAATHSMMHGRVLLQYRPDLAAVELRGLERLVVADPEGVLLFENRTGMPAPVAATAYQSLLTCPRVDRSTLRALAAFRVRRSAFGQAF